MQLRMDRIVHAFFKVILWLRLTTSLEKLDQPVVMGIRVVRNAIKNL